MELSADALTNTIRDLNSSVCPELASTHWLENTEISTDKIVQAIEAMLNTEISFPDIYPGAVGAKSGSIITHSEFYEVSFFKKIDLQYTGQIGFHCMFKGI